MTKTPLTTAQLQALARDLRNLSPADKLRVAAGLIDERECRDVVNELLERVTFELLGLKWKDE